MISHEELSAAAEKRDRYFGRDITYSRKVFIPLTNLCRDACGYCTFARNPSEPGAGYLTPDDVLRIAESGRRAGCKEALFSLGERPELRYPEAREALAHLGHTRTVDYLRETCDLVLRETGLLPHVNAGTLSEEEMRLLRPVSGSMGMMLETVSTRLMEKGQVHYGCPDKHPALRLKTLETAGRLNVPFTTGLLIGIGETWDERVDTLVAIEEIYRRYGSIQEVIIQNFRAKPDIRISAWPEPGLDDMLRTIAAARVILDGAISLQAPPNLEPGQYAEYIDAGLNDWGGVSPVTPDHINPERAWPKIAELRAATESKGFRLRERLTIYPRHLFRRNQFLSPALHEPVAALAGVDGLAAQECLS